MMEQRIEVKMVYGTQFASLEKYREELYQQLGKRRDAAMDLIDALACRRDAQSVTELSEQPEFVRQYPSIRDAIHYAGDQQTQLAEHMQKCGIQHMPHVIIDEQPYHLYAVDSTPNAHPHAHCLKDRSYIHDARHKVTGKPINIGHQYSAVVGITEDSAWISPVRMERIPTDEKPTEFGIKQALTVCEASPESSIILLDSAYNNASCQKLMKGSKAIVVVRSACNRNYHIPAGPADYKGRGRYPRYGQRIHLHDLQQGARPDEFLVLKPNDHPGHIHVYYWKKVYTKMEGMKGYENPSALVVLIEYREDGAMKHKNPWVIRVFDPTGKFNCSYGAWLYSFRFSIEGFFSVKKKKLLFDKFQSCEVKHRETFCLMGSLAYQQWYLAKSHGEMNIPVKPWMRYPKDQPKGLALNPGNTQRGFSNVLKQVGTPSVYRPPRVIPPGRTKGAIQKKDRFKASLKKMEAFLSPKPSIRLPLPA